MVLLGVIAAAAVPYFGHGTLANVRAGGFARRLAMDLVHAKRATIATGKNHFIRFTSGDGQISQYTLYYDPQVLVDSAQGVPSGVTVATSHTDCRFIFDGSAEASYTITIDGAHKRWTINVVAATGAVRTTESLL